jgi:hypothetical protein
VASEARRAFRFDYAIERAGEPIADGDVARLVDAWTLRPTRMPEWLWLS